MKKTIGVIGGSGLYQIEGLGAVETARVPLPEHRPSEPLDASRAVVYLASDASAALEGSVVVA